MSEEETKTPELELSTVTLQPDDPIDVSASTLASACVILLSKGKTDTRRFAFSELSTVVLTVMEVMDAWEDHPAVWTGAQKKQYVIRVVQLLLDHYDTYVYDKLPTSSTVESLVAKGIILHALPLMLDQLIAVRNGERLVLRSSVKRMGRRALQWLTKRIGRCCCCCSSSKK